ncbi:MAG: F0F1 ATP synthase subunit beta, partial [Gammaproteobacteria bacterium]|nr:F0F1 ATP synthase subunit beta [Gammaproteobacteria bacterium]
MQAPDESTRPELPRGRVTAVSGSVLDVEFPPGHLPAINHALTVCWDGAHGLTAEVQLHVGPSRVRAVAMQDTAGLQSGVEVRDTGAPIEVPTGDAVLGRLLNVVGEPIDHGPAFAADVRREPIHRPAPGLDRQSSNRELFLTGIKIIDLLAPLSRGGKAGMFGGAGVGKTVLIM